MPAQSPYRFVLYARKSEEDRSRQVQSRADQVNELRHVAERDGLNVVGELREEQSAKAPGRPVFSAMVAKIQAGEANPILVWSINRLLKNPVDEGAIKWMLQEGIIRAIRTIDKEYRPEDNVLLLGVESGVATQFIADLRKGVVRGMRSKVEKGWYPHRAPLVCARLRHPKTSTSAILAGSIARSSWRSALASGSRIATT
jgi:DNA invertase Pin-like site-specific DNA recombinase